MITFSDWKILENSSSRETFTVDVNDFDFTDFQIPPVYGEYFSSRDAKLTYSLNVVYDKFGISEVKFYFEEFSCTLIVEKYDEKTERDIETEYDIVLKDVKSFDYEIKGFPLRPTEMIIDMRTVDAFGKIHDKSASVEVVFGSKEED